jgi:ABC-type nitrate/sulfonate/bicarbonate transport system substrate-binding protein
VSRRVGTAICGLLVLIAATVASFVAFISEQSTDVRVTAAFLVIPLLVVSWQAMVAAEEGTFDKEER